MKIYKTDLATYNNTSVTGALSVDGGGGFLGNIIIANTTDTSGIHSGSLVTYGGVGITKNLYVGGTIYKNTMDNVLLPNDWYCIYYYNSAWSTKSITIALKSPDGSTVIMHNTGSSYTTELINYNVSTTGRVIAFDTYSHDETISNPPPPSNDIFANHHIEQKFVANPSTSPTYLQTIRFYNMYYKSYLGVSNTQTTLNIYNGTENDILIYTAPIIFPLEQSTFLDYTIYGAIPIISGQTYTIQILITSTIVSPPNIQQLQFTTTNTTFGEFKYDSPSYTTTQSLIFELYLGTTSIGRQILVNGSIAGTGYEINTSVASSLGQIINFKTTELVTPQTVPPLFGTPSYDSSTDTNKIVYLNESVAITSTIQSTSTNTGSLTIIGGAGIGGNLYVGNSIYLPTTNETPTSLNYYTANITDAAWTYNNTSITPTPKVYYSIVGNDTQKTVTLDFSSVSYTTSDSSNFSLLIASPLYAPKYSKSFPVEVFVDSTVISTGWGTIDTSGNINVYYNYPNGVFAPAPSTPVGFSSFSITYIAHT